MSPFTAELLGSRHFRQQYGLRYAYLSGAMYKGIASRALVAEMGKAGMLGFLGTGGMGAQEIEESIDHLKRVLPRREPFGVNLLCNLDRPELEEELVDLCLRHDVRYIEASAFLGLTPSLVRCRLKGLKRLPSGEVVAARRIMAKISRPEVATAFMAPAPEDMVRALVNSGAVTTVEATLGATLPMADSICVEADSAGHTDQGVAYALMPAILSLRDEAMTRHRYSQMIHVGAAGGIGTPQAAAAALIMGADFILTGSINQCTVEAGTSDAVKDLLQRLNVQDTTYAPAGDMFELGAKVQVAKNGLLFAARANRLFDLYQRFDSLEDIDARTRAQIQEKYFRRSFEEVWSETRAYYERVAGDRIADIERNPKKKMALVFKWYFVHTNRLALRGDTEQKVDYQVHCGPALGSFNQWVKGTALESWRNRNVADLGLRIMQGTAKLLGQRFAEFHEAAIPELAAVHS